jgi:ligand-binding SRPBCC domain-containing protein
MFRTATLGIAVITLMLSAGAYAKQDKKASSRRRWPPSEPPQADHVTPAGMRRGWLRSVAGRPDRGVTRLKYETLVDAPLEATFAFFSDASNLERLTPGWVQFSIVTPLPIVMRAGLEIDYRIRLHGVPLAWTSRIDVWEPGRRFVDCQIAGPYLWWRHEHRFEAAGSWTRVIDEVEYLPRAAWMTARVVRRDVERIFRHRQDALQQIFDHPIEGHDG